MMKTFSTSSVRLYRAYACVGILSVCLLLLVQGCGIAAHGPRMVDGGILFSLEAPGAKRVMIAGSFNGWDTGSISLTGPDEKGTWSAVIPLPEGYYEYLFFVDGKKWVLDPSVPVVDDGMGGKNSALSVRE